MQNSKAVIVAAIVCLIVGFTAGFVLRPVIAPPTATGERAPGVVSASASRSSEPRGVQYFEANIEEARRVVAGCTHGSIRGGESANAEQAIVTVDSAERRRRFFDR